MKKLTCQCRRPRNDPPPDFVIPLHGAPHKKDKTAAARAKTYRQRKRQRVEVAAAAKVGRPSSAVGAIAEPSEVQPAGTPPAVTVDRDEAVTPHHEEPIAPPRIVGDRFHVEHRDATGQSFNRSAVMAVAPVLLTIAAFALSAVGIAINGWFARSLGSSDLAGWLFLTVGVAADLAALVLPSTAAGLWRTGQRATALVGWVVFVFAVTAGIGFASTNISDVTLGRASRVTPAVMSAQAMLADAMAARDGECKGGVGKFCREREAFAERRAGPSMLRASDQNGAVLDLRHLTAGKEHLHRAGQPASPAPVSNPEPSIGWGRHMDHDLPITPVRPIPEGGCSEHACRMLEARGEGGHVRSACYLSASELLRRDSLRQFHFDAVDATEVQRAALVGEGHAFERANPNTNATFLTG